jgi:hypothetical protein
VQLQTQPMLRERPCVSYASSPANVPRLGPINILNCPTGMSSAKEMTVSRGMSSARAGRVGCQRSGSAVLRIDRKACPHRLAHDAQAPDGSSRAGSARGRWHRRQPSIWRPKSSKFRPHRSRTPARERRRRHGVTRSMPASVHPFGAATEPSTSTSVGLGDAIGVTRYRAETAPNSAMRDAQECAHALEHSSSVRPRAQERAADQVEFAARRR